MGQTRAIMFTMTTYGSWLRGDRRGWIDDGRVLPADPDLEAVDAGRMVQTPYLFSQHQLYDVGLAIGLSLGDRLGLTVLALSAQRWHVHLVVGATNHDVGDIVKCAKEAVRYRLRPGRPIWSGKYDKRFCFDDASVRGRVNYVERHNEQIGLSPRPWPFITDVNEYLSPAPT